jgi:hypothetical protein
MYRNFSREAGQNLGQILGDFFSNMGQRGLQFKILFFGILCQILRQSGTVIIIHLNPYIGSKSWAQFDRMMSKM